jgi:hypothetical protein
MSVVPMFGLVGGLLVVVGLFFFIRTRNFLGKAHEAKGTVIEMAYRQNSSADSNSGGGYVPVYQFETEDKQRIVKQDGLATNPPRYQVGQTIDILYDPENPEKAHVNRWMNLYFVPALLGGLGLIFCGAAVAIAVL